MSSIGHAERVTQNRIVRLFRDELGYRYLADWSDREGKRIDYEEYLKRVAALARNVASGVADDTPDVLKRSPGLRAIYNNLRVLEPAFGFKEESPGYESEGDRLLDLAQRLDRAVKQARPDGWRGVLPKEQVVKQALFQILDNVEQVERLFAVIKQQPEY